MSGPTIPRHYARDRAAACRALLLALALQLPAAVRSQCSGSTYSWSAAPTSCASCAPSSLFLGSGLGCSPAASVAAGDTAFSSGPTDTVFFLSGMQTEGVSAFSASAAPAFVTSHLAAPAGALALSASGSYLTADASGPLAAALPSDGAEASASAWYKCAPGSQPAGSAATLLEWGASGTAAANVMQGMSLKFTLQVSTPPSYSVATIAGGFSPTTGKIWADGAGLAAAFNAPMGMAFDASGTIWIADTLNFVVRTISPAGVVATVAGANPVNAFSNGYVDGPGNTARFTYPYGIAISPSTSTVYVTDRGNQCIRAISAGVVSTVAGQCIGRTNLYVKWYSRPVATAMVNGAGTNAVFVSPSGIAVVGSALYVTDRCVIRKIDLANNNAVTTWAGGAGGVNCGAIIEATGTSAQFSQAPLHLGQLAASNHLASDGVNIFIADRVNQAILKVVIATRALTKYAWGDAMSTPGTGLPGIGVPEMVTATTPGGPLYLTDYGSIYKVFPGGGQWAPVAGYATGAAWADTNGVGTAAGFKGLNAVIVDASGNLVTSQNGGLNMVRRLTFIPQPQPPCDNKWHHLAQTFSGNVNFFDPGTLQVFLDGAPFRSTTIALMNPSNLALRIGWNGLGAQGNNGDLFVGSVSDLRVYTRQLTNAEVLGLAQPPLPTFLSAIVAPSKPTAGASAYTWFCVPGTTGATQAWALASTTNTWTLTGGPVSCSSCVAGQFAVGSACFSCAAGTFSTTAGAAACTACPAGTSSTPGSTSCTACAPGYFSAAGAPACAACPSGSYGTSPPSASCTPCSANFYLPTAGATNSGSCLACGQGSSQPGSSFCVCPAGSFNAAGDAAATTCSSCSAGSYSFGSAACATCSASAGATFVSASLGCAPATGATDTVFYLSGRADEGVASFGVIGAASNVTFAPDFQNIASGALSLGQNAFLATPSAAANALAASLPAGGSPAASAAAWVRCAAEAQQPASAATIIEWGVSGSAAAQPATKFALTVAQTAQAPTVTVFAGGYQSPGGGFNTFLNGPSAKSTFKNSRAMVAAPGAGFLYVADRYCCVRKVSLSTGDSSMFAGFDYGGPHTMDFAGGSNNGYVDATGTNAKFDDPVGLALHPTTGTLYVADVAGQCIRAVSPGAAVSTLAGQCCGKTSATGSQFACATAATNGAGTAATFLAPTGIALNPAASTLFVMDKCRLRTVDLASRQVSAFAGGACGAAVDGYGAAAVFNMPPLGTFLWVPANGVAADGRGNLFVADEANGRIRLVSMSTAAVSTYSTALAQPSGLAVNPVDGLLYASDLSTHKISRVFPGGAAIAVAGSGVNGIIGTNNYVIGGAATSATFSVPRALAPLPNGNIMAIDNNYAILQLNFYPPALPYCDNKWRHLALTFSGGASGVPRAYVDGVLVRTGAPMALNLPASSSAVSALRIGWNGDLSANGGDTFVGSLADVRVYARQLTAAEVLALSQPPLPTASATVTVTPAALIAGATKYVVACAAGFAGSPITLAREPANLSWAGGPASSFGGCAQCAPGTYALAGSAACVACPAGSYSTAAGSSACTPCAPNTYSTAVGANSNVCAACAAGGGAYAPAGAAVCLCPAGTFLASGDAAASVCSPCPANTYALGGAVACTTCPAGTTFVTAVLGCRPTTAIALAPVDTAFYFSGAAAGASAVAVVRNASAATSYITGWMNAAGGALSLGADATSGAFLGTSPTLAPAALGSGSASLTLSARFKCALGSLGASAGTLVEWGAVGSAAAQPTAKLALLASTPALRVVTTVLSGGLSSPQGMAFDALGTTLYIADTFNQRIKALALDGTLTTLAGSGAGPYPNGGGYLDSAVALNAQFNNPWGVTVDRASGVVYIVELLNQCVRSYNPSTGAVATVAGAGRGGAVNAVPAATAAVDGVGTNALFVLPSSIAIDGSGSVLFVADMCAIRRIVIATRVVTTFSGGPCAFAVDAPGTSARFNAAQSLTADLYGTLYVADYSNNMVRKISMASGVTTTFARGVPGVGGRATAVAVDTATGIVYVADSYSNLLTSVGPAGGSRAPFSGNAAAMTNLGGADGPISTATFSSPTALAIGADGNMYVLDSGAGWVRKVTLSTSACDGKWHHMTTSFSSGMRKTYFDGYLSMTSSAALSIPSGAGASAVRVGWNGDLSVNGGDTFPGVISDVRVFARAVTDSEAVQLALPPLVYPFTRPTSPQLGASAYTVDCAAGAYGPIVTLVQSPTDGTWIASGGGIVNCQQCGPGQYSAGQAVSCSGTPCPAGFTGLVGSIVPSGCSACPPGSWAAAGDVSCTGVSCVPGTFGMAGAPNATAAACIPCPGGMYAGGYSASSCQGTPCAPGSFSNLPAIFNWGCTNCPAGQWTGATGSRSCQGALCRAGSFGVSGSTTQAQAVCSLCPPGTFSKDDGMSTCSGNLCPANTYGAAGLTYQMATPCTPCPAGMTSPPGATTCSGSACAAGTFGPSCTQCAAGTWSSVQGSAACSGTPCPAGFFGPRGSTSSAQATCTACPSGTWSNVAGVSSCAGGAACSPGYYGATGRTAPGSVCTACSPGTFSSTPGSATCTTCAAGQFTLSAGQSSCMGSVCIAGSYALVGPASSAGCGPCPSGTWSAAAATVCTGTPCAAGSAGPTGSVTAAAATCALCVSGTYSAAAGAGSCAGSPCPAGFIGPIGRTSAAAATCTACPSGLFQAANGTSACSAGITGGQCPAGSFGPTGQTSAVASTCSLCVSGTYTSSSGLGACVGTPCALGFFGTAGLTYANGCSMCPSGLYTSSTGQTLCVGSICPPGSVGPLASTSALAAICSVCPSGKSISYAGASACIGTACLAGYFGPTNVSDNTLASCSRCPSGTFTNATGLGECFGTPCPPGSFGSGASTTASAATCSLCPSGTYTSVSGAESCVGAPSTNCALGYVGPLGSTSAGAATCTACEPGTFSSVRGNVSCIGTVCAAGTWGYTGSTSSQSYTSKCLPCPSGTYSGVGATSCIGTPCGLGYYGPVGAASAANATCTACPAGTSNPVGTGLAACGSGSLCAAGFYGTVGSSAWGGSPCYACAPGTYSSAPGSSACAGTPCAPGTYGPTRSTSAAAATCTPCPAGTFAASSGTATCSGTPCPAGTYSSGGTGATSASSASCLTCSAGQYSTTSGSTACLGTLCSPGTYGPSGAYSASAATCTACAPGTFSNSSGLSACYGSPCPAGQFGSAGATTPGSASCAPCPGGTYARYPGSTACTGTPCAPGSYSPLACSAQGCSGNGPANYPYCTVCPPGTYSSGTGAAACVGTVCPAGQFGPTGQTSTTNCSACLPGTYSASSGSTFCYGAVCAAGYSGPAGQTNQAAATCTACPGGSYSSAPGATNCTAVATGVCSPGTYSGTVAATSAAAAQCQPCPSGTFSSNSGATSCSGGTICAIGTYGTAGQSSANSCTPAPSGTFVNMTGATSYFGTPCAAGSVGPVGQSTAAAATCALCAPGLYTATAGLGPTCSGTLCAAGTFAAPGASAAVTCSPCAAGSYTSSTGQSSCLPCGGGLYQPSPGQTSCRQCGAGNYSLAGVPGGNAACLPCEVGTASAWSTAAASCGACPAGTYQNVTGMTTCLNCPAGTFQAQTGQTNCTLCNPGTYMSGTGAASCTQASTNFFVPSPGGRSQTACAAGSVAGGGASACTICPMGSYAYQYWCQLCFQATYSTVVGATSCTGSCLYTSMGAISCAYNSNSAGNTNRGAVARSASVSVSFFGTASGRIVSLNEGANSTLTIAGELALANGESPVVSATAAPAFNAAFFGIGTSPGKVVQINTTTPTPTKSLASVTFSAGENQAVCLVLDSVNNFLYVGTATSPSFIVQVAVAARSAPVRTGSLLLSGAAIVAGSSGATSVGALVAAAIDIAGGFAYFVSGSVPALVAKLDLTAASAGIASAQVTLLALPASYGAATVALLDSSFLYVAAGPSSQSVLARVELGSFSSLDALALVDAAGISDGMVLAATWGPITAPSLVLTFSGATPRVVLVNTTTFTRIGGIAYTTGVTDFIAVSASDAVGAPFAYTVSGPISWTNQYYAVPLSLCPAGTYSSGWGSCASCPAGTYAPSAGHIVCVPCPAGTASTASGATSLATCNPCLGGTYATAGSSACVACPARPGTVGTYAVANLVSGTNTYLYTCNAGSSMNFTNVTTVCSAASGAFMSLSPTPICPVCPIGTFATAGASNCTICPGGTANPSTGGTSSSSCVACSAGWAAAPGSASCSACGPGSWTASAGMAACSTCAVGASFPGYGATSGGLCSACPAGSAGVAGVSACMPCARGTYTSSAGASICLPCSRGTTTLTTGATSCVVPDTAILSIAGTSLSSPPGAVAYDSASGTAYIAVPALGSVVAVGAYFTSAPVLANFSGLGTPAGLALDAFGNLLVADALTGALWVVSRATGSKFPAVSGLATANATTGDAGLVGVCVDGNGTVYLLESLAASSGSRVLIVSGVAAAAAARAANSSSPLRASMSALAVSGNGTGILIGAAPASIAVDLDAPGGPIVLIGAASGAILAVPTSGADSVVAWATLPQTYAVSTLLVDLPTRSVYVVQALVGAVSLLSLDSAAVVTSLAGPLADAGGLAIDLISGQLLYASVSSGNVTVAFSCDSAAAGTGFLQPCALAACSAGSASVTAGFCVSCTAGSYSSYAGASSCAPCPWGTYSIEPASMSCLACPVGSSTLAPGSSSAFSCISCPAGSFAPPSGGACALCPPGSYSASEGASACSLCPPGTVTSQPGATSAESCLWCPRSSAAYGYGSSACLPCASSTPALQAAASTAVASSTCGAATYANDYFTQYGVFNFAPLAMDAALGYVFLGQTYVPQNPKVVLRAQVGSSAFHTNRGSLSLGPPGTGYAGSNPLLDYQAITTGVLSQSRRTLIVGTKSTYTNTNNYALLAAFRLDAASVDGFASVPGSPIALNTGEASVTSLVTDDVFVYASTNAGTLIKLRISNLARTATMNFTSVGTVGAAVIDAPAGVAYYAAGTTGGAVAKVNLTSLSVISNATLGFSAGVTTLLLDPSRNAFVVHLKTCPVQLVWISTESLAVIGSLTLPDLCSAMPVVFPQSGAVAADGTSLVAAFNSGPTTSVWSLAVVSVNITAMAQSSPAIFTGIASGSMLGVFGDAASGAIYVPNGASLQAVQVTGGIVLPYYTVTAAASPANGAAADATNQVAYVPVAQSLVRVRMRGSVPRVTATLPAVAPTSSTMGACGLDAVAQFLYCGYVSGSVTYLVRVSVNASSFSNSTSPTPPMALQTIVTAFGSAAVPVRAVITDAARGYVYVALRDGTNDRQRIVWSAGAEQDTHLCEQCRANLRLY